MATVLARLHVDDQGRVTGRVPPSVPPGDDTDSLVLPAAAPAIRPKLNLPVHDEPWDDHVSLRREDLHGDDGRRAARSRRPAAIRRGRPQVDASR
jgi:hypothetical protein